LPKRVKKTLEQAAARRIEGITGKGPVWEREAKKADAAYKTGFGPIFSCQVEASDAVLAEGLTGYAALTSYASKVKECVERGAR